MVSNGGYKSQNNSSYSRHLSFACLPNYLLVDTAALGEHAASLALDVHVEHGEHQPMPGS